MHLLVLTEVGKPQFAIFLWILMLIYMMAPWRFQKILALDISQLSQFDPASEQTVFDYAAEKFTLLQSEIDAICKEMETSTDLDSLLVLFSKKN